MPKLMPGLRERMIQAARKQLLGQAHDVTIRGVANACGAAVGTVYNYFPSKEALLTAVMLEDWLACLEGMSAAARDAGSPMAALEGVVRALRGFTGRYEPAWRNYAGEKGSVGELGLRHRQVIEAISSPVAELLDRFDACNDPCLPEVLSELVLMASRSDDGFERVAYAFGKLLA